MLGKNNDPPPAPDYSALAQSQGQLNQVAADRAQAANRPNQVTNQGTSTWTVDPTTGQWTQKVTLSPGQQALYDAQMGQKQQISGATGGLLGSAIDAMGRPLNMSGLPQVQGLNQGALSPAGQQLQTTAGQMQQFDPSKLSGYGSLNYGSLGAMPEAGFGAVEDVRKAMLARQQPDLDIQRQREIQRMKAQGFNETDEAMGTIQDRLNRKDVDAQNQALLGATTAYGDIFNRGMDVRREGATELKNAADFANNVRSQQAGEQLAGGQFNNNIKNTQFGQQAQASAYANMLRAQQLSEQNTMRSASIDDRQRALSEQMLQRSLPMSEYQQMAGQTQAVNPTFPSFTNVAGANAANMQGAAEQQYAAQAGAYNQQQAAQNAQLSGLLSTAGAVVGGIYGGPAGAAAGGAAGRGLAGTPQQAATPYWSVQNGGLYAPDGTSAYYPEP
jgi:hypothetical protein